MTHFPYSLQKSFSKHLFSIKNTEFYNKCLLRAPTGWGSFLDKSSNMPASNQQSFNCSGFPWEQLVPKDAGNISVPGMDQEKASPGQNQSLGGTGMNMSKAAETSVALETSCMGPLDPSFYSGKISARSTSLGPSGEYYL